MYCIVPLYLNLRTGNPVKKMYSKKQYRKLSNNMYFVILLRGNVENKKIYPYREDISE